MSFSRREFLQVLAVASASGMTIAHEDVLAAKPGAVSRLYSKKPVGFPISMSFPVYAP